MNKTAALKIVNPVLGLLLANQVVTGLLHDRLSHETFEIMHGGGGMLLAVAAGIHVSLNWSWIKANLMTVSKVFPGPLCCVAGQPAPQHVACRLVAAGLLGPASNFLKSRQPD